MSYDPTLPPEPGYNQFRTTNQARHREHNYEARCRLRRFDPGYSCHPLSEQIYMQYPDVMDWHTGIVATASKHTHTRQRNA